MSSTETAMVLTDDNSKKLQIGDSIPHFSLVKTDGSTVDSKTIGEPIFVVVFTCNHCPYAQAYEDRLIALQKEYKRYGICFVLINSNDAQNYPEDSFENMKKRAAEKNYPFFYCYDEDQSVATRFGALCTPHCFVFDTQRTLRYKGRVDDSWDDPSAVTSNTLHDAIDALVNGEEIAIPEANAIGCSIKWKD